MEKSLLEKNNTLVLVGKVADEKKFSHEIYEEKFYTFNLSVARLSGNTDLIPITISERLFKNEDLEIGKKIKIEGQFRSYNTYEDEKNRLYLTVFVKEFEVLDENKEDSEEADKEPDEEELTNEITLIGYICKPPIYRQTPFGREISDILLAVNRAYNKSDYIPCIAWGRNARFCSKMEVGTEVKVVGRIQSRSYEKKHEDGTVEERVAYEVSISNLELVENNDENEEDEIEEKNSETLENSSENN